jgi:hypothetical protein
MLPASGNVAIVDRGALGVSAGGASSVRDNQVYGAIPTEAAPPLDAVTTPPAVASTSTAAAAACCGASYAVDSDDAMYADGVPAKDASTWACCRSTLTIF